MHNNLLVHENRLMVPNENELRTRLCDEFHRLLHRAHFERGKMRKIICQQYFWPGMKSYINRYIGNCPECKRNKNSRFKPAGLLRSLPIPQKPWQYVIMDFKSFNKDRHSYNAILIIVDRLNKRSFCLPTHKTYTAADLAKLYYTFPWRIFGTPETIISDRGPQFVAEFSKELAKLTGITFQRLTAEYAETNNQTEIVNQFIQTRLRSFVNYFQDNWFNLLPYIDFAMAIQPHDATGLSPAEVDLGYLFRMLFDWEARFRKPLNYRNRMFQQ
jgi:hypothetical protein